MIKKFKREVIYTVTEKLYCDKCDVEMVRTQIVLTSNPPKFPHICPKCGNQKATLEVYPVTYDVYGKEEEIIEKE